MTDFDKKLDKIIASIFNDKKAYSAKAELKALMESCVPPKKEIGTEPLDTWHQNVGFNQSGEETLANIERIFG